MIRVVARRRRSARRPVFAAAAALVIALVCSAVTPGAQGTGPTGLVASRSVNMVSGDKWPTGDPYLQRQNEPSMAASTRNPLHMLAGANDYRTVDLPGLPDGGETGDAWLGLFKSFDGGERWQSSLLPGYPQDTSADGLASPLHGYQAGADASVRAGTNGLIYYGGLVFNRGPKAPSAIFLSSFVDNNNKENGDPIAYLGTNIVDQASGAYFLDKPWIAVDVPRAGAKVCRVSAVVPPPVVTPKGQKDKNDRDERDRRRGKTPKPPAPQPGAKTPKPVTQSVPAGTIYVAYARITTTGTDVESRIMFAQSDDCGGSWSRPVQLSRPQDKVNQGASIAIDPKTGAVYVSWRQFGAGTTDTDSVMVAHQTFAGRQFDEPLKVHEFNAGRGPRELFQKFARGERAKTTTEAAQIKPFDQTSAGDRFRTNAYPSLAVDDQSRVYLAWTERGFGAARPGSADGDARVVLSTSRTGYFWTDPKPVDSGTGANDMPGHQLMPSIAFAGGKLMIIYYDLREDVSRVFGPFIDETDAVTTVHKRHTIDLRAAVAAAGDVPVFSPSIKVSQYLMGSPIGSTSVEQLQYNAPDLPLFQLGSVPFMGDYIDLAPSPAFVVNKQGQWIYNTASTTAPVFHAVWTDNRDVRPPADGDWTHYTPPGLAARTSTFDPSQPAPLCLPGQVGMRNQNIYTARLTLGLIAGSPGNTKPLDPKLPRAFVVFAQNTTSVVKTFRLTIGSQPAGGHASFTQLAAAGGVFPLTTVDVSVAPRSMVTRTVFITSTDPKAQVPVGIQEIAAPNASGALAGGLASTVVLNPDISNPDISNPDISNPDISNPDISNAEVYNPDISNPDISNPDISNPDISNPDISNPDISNISVANPDISNPDISNPDISNPDISNPDISNPDISNPDISNGALSDVTWNITNTGNTTASFNVTLFLANAAQKLGGIKTQLIVHKTYTTPVASGCTLKSQTQTVLVANVINPTFKAPGTSAAFDPTNPDISNTTLWLEPGGTGKITLRVVNPDPLHITGINPVTDVTPNVQSQPVNTPDLGTPNPQPPSTTPPTAPDVQLTFTAQPGNTILNAPMAPITVHVLLNSMPGPAVPASGVQVTIAIAINPVGGHLSGTTTLVTDALGNATFNGLSIDKTATGYRLSASASASGAVPILTNPVNVTLAPTTATATGGAFTYDGQSHGGTCAVTGFGGAVLTGTVSYSSGVAPTNAGTYTLTCAFSGDSYYAPSTASDTIAITPLSATVAALNATKVYGTTPDPALAASETGFLAGDAAGITLTSTRAAGEAAGTYAMTATATGGNIGNYAVTYLPGTFTITPATPVATATGGTFVYDGNPHAGTCAVAGLNGDALTGALTYSSGSAPVNAGNYTATCAIAAGGNYAAASANAAIVITPATPVATATGGTFDYDGQPHAGSCTVTGVNGAILGGTSTYDSGSAPVNVGNYTLTCAIAAAGNYTAAASSAAITIKATATITSVTPVNGKPGDGFVVVRGSNLPTDAAIVVSGAATQTGFVFQSPSTSTAVWVRLPFGQPLGVGTIQLKNTAGTIVSNAFSVTVTAVPGTPVITGVYDAGVHPVAAPVAAGGTVYVAADGIDTTGATVRFVQGAHTWDVSATSTVSSSSIGVAAQVAVPAGVATGPINISIQQDGSAFSATVTINVTAAATPTWAASGPGTVTVVDNGSTGHPQMSYNYDLRVPPVTGSGGGVPLTTWEFSTGAAQSGTVNLAWSYSGLHAWFAVTAQLVVFVRHNGVDSNVQLVNAAPQNCCTTPSNGFSYAGTSTVVVQAGDTYGFKMSGSNGDSNSFLQGTITIGVSAPSPLVELTESVSNAGSSSPVAEDAEDWRRGRS